MRKRIAALFATGCLLATVIPFTGSAESNTEVWNLPTYNDYRSGSKYQSASGDIRATADNLSESSTGYEVKTGIGGFAEKAVVTGDTSSVEFTFEVPADGAYYILLDYYPMPGKGSQIEREIYIDGKLPFYDAADVEFDRLWKSQEELTHNPKGDDNKPKQVETPDWISAYVTDTRGYSIKPLLFDFSKGTHTVRFDSLNEPMAIRTVTLAAPVTYQSYSEVLKEYQSKGYQNAEKSLPVLEGEQAVLKSSQTLYPISDKDSPANQPYSAKYIWYNAIGGSNWSEPGQWLEWEVDVETAGLYHIGARFKQNFVNGSYVTRKLTINDTVPFAEAENIQFNFNTKWQTDYFGDQDNGDYLFYLKEGKNKIRLEVTLGQFAPVLERLQQSISALNDAYRQIIMITGTNPDIYRDYQFEKVIPEVLATLKEQEQKLNEISAELKKINGKNAQTTTIDVLALDLKTMHENTKKLAPRLSSFNGDLSALAEWVLSSGYQALEIDYLLFDHPGAELPAPDVGFWSKLWNDIKMFFYSFSDDYNNLEQSGKAQKRVVAWTGQGILAGRDQTAILQQMINDTFTPETGIAVDLQLVANGTLLPATLAGNGPDVALQIPMTEPVNYAIRGALADLKQFSDYDKVADRFTEQALVPYQISGGSYAIPETFSFPVMFYRADILSEMGLKVPETWQELYSIIPNLVKQNMTIGIPSSSVATAINMSATDASAPHFDTYAIMLMQAGLPIYNGDGESVPFGGQQYIKVFQQWTDLFRKYGLPITYDFVNRFRSGEMPIAIADYTNYNQLSVFAPEIAGRWAFTNVPGTQKQDGTIDHSTISSGNGCILMSMADDKDAAWEFIKWWTDADAQARFGQELESMLGQSARYPTANIKALGQLPWTVADYKALMKQWDSAQSIPQVPGGYITARYLDFAFKAVVNKNADPGEQLLMYVPLMNGELTRKREEFGFSK